MRLPRLLHLSLRITQGTMRGLVGASGLELRPKGTSTWMLSIHRNLRSFVFFFIETLGFYTLIQLFREMH